MRIIFIRHGQTDSNVNHLLDTAYPGAPLNATGLDQAESLVERLANEPIEVVVTSDITRARQTGEPLAEAHGVQLVTHPGVREIYAGDWEMDEDWHPYIEVIDSWKTDLTVAMPNGDDGVGFFKRYDAAIEELNDHGCVAIVSHGAALRTWLGARCQLDLSKDPVGTDGLWRWVLHNTDAVVVEGVPGAWRILSWAGHPLE